MDEETRQFIVDSVGTFDRWFWPPELFIEVYGVIVSCKYPRVRHEDEPNRNREDGAKRHDK